MGKFFWAWYSFAAAILFLIWLMLSALLAVPIVPSPILVFENIIDIFVSDIAIHSAYSVYRMGMGLILAIIIGFPMGVAMGYFKKCDNLLAPLVYLTYPIPKIALIPIVMLVFGLGDISKIVMIFLIVVFQVIVAVRDGIRMIPKETYYPLYSLGASFKHIFMEVLWPASLPNFITAIRVAMATAVSVLFFTETFGTKYGMGYFIMDAWLRVNYLEMYSGIVVLSLIGLVIFTTIDIVENSVCRWQRK